MDPEITKILERDALAKVIREDFDTQFPNTPDSELVEIAKASKLKGPLFVLSCRMRDRVKATTKKQRKHLRLVH